MEKWDIYDSNRIKTGRIGIRGNRLKQGEYHLVVFAIIRNSSGEFIISKRAPEKTYPNTWEITGGAAVSGDTSYSAVIREVKEELGIHLESEGKLLNTYRIEDTECSHFADVWFFEHDIDMSQVVHQPGEVTDAKLVSREEIHQLFLDGKFMPGNPHIYKSFDKL